MSSSSPSVPSPVPAGTEAGEWWEAVPVGTPVLASFLGSKGPQPAHRTEAGWEADDGMVGCTPWSMRPDEVWLPATLAAVVSSSPATPACQCGHDEAVHEGYGCRARPGCSCTGYDPPATPGGGEDRAVMRQALQHLNAGRAGLAAALIETRLEAPSPATPEGGRVVAAPCTCDPMDWRASPSCAFHSPATAPSPAFPAETREGRARAAGHWLAVVTGSHKMGCGCGLWFERSDYAEHIWAAAAASPAVSLPGEAETERLAYRKVLLAIDSCDTIPEPPHSEYVKGRVDGYARVRRAVESLYDGSLSLPGEQPGGDGR